MIGKTPTEHQRSIFEVALVSFMDMIHEPVLPSKRIDWEAVESEFSEYYCMNNGRSSVPIRAMVGLMLLKNIYNLSDKCVVAHWQENPYMLYLTGKKVFQQRPPAHLIDMVNLKKRARIEPVIGPLESDYRMMRNYLKGTLGGAIYMLMAAAVYKMRHWMNINAWSFILQASSAVQTLLKCVINSNLSIAA